MNVGAGGRGAVAPRFGKKRRKNPGKTAKNWGKKLRKKFKNTRQKIV